MTNQITRETFKAEYKKCSTYGDWERLITRMDAPLIREIHTALSTVIETTGATMREESFVRILGRHITFAELSYALYHEAPTAPEPAKHCVEVLKTTLGSWNNGRTNATSNCYYTGKSPCYGILINDTKIIAFRRKCDADAFKVFAEDTGHYDSGDPEMLFYQWLIDNKVKDPSAKRVDRPSNAIYDLDKIKVVD